ncbi:hypothetical protein OOT33_06670 [Sphingobium sp. DEHP117]|uniref:hypothetical protein n=1 Tax=Sphingobium sp. DEHP117 TaxID=2993436 RepID=UPI0027D6E325|nr:hypothetical protein [Sphingobium sp. DEHP117]MDQ4420118.1 hypothetical protein [Sphingobium sp. DEHP117]
MLPLTEELGISVLVMQPLRWGVLLADPTADELAALEVGDWGAAILRWILSDARVSSVLTATSRSGRIAANAAAARQEPFDTAQRSLVERILDRGPRQRDTRPRPSAELADELRQFLSQRLGASFCDTCLARFLAADLQTIATARIDLSTDLFAQEVGACLNCGNEGPMIRSRTIMR